MLLAIIALLTSVFSIFYSQSSLEQVYVDVNKLLDGYKRTKLVRAEFETKTKTVNAQNDDIKSLKKENEVLKSVLQRLTEIEEQLNNKN